MRLDMRFAAAAQLDGLALTCSAQYVNWPLMTEASAADASWRPPMDSMKSKRAAGVRSKRRMKASPSLSLFSSTAFEATMAADAVQRGPYLSSPLFVRRRP